MIGLPGAEATVRCSRARCQNAATWSILWRNPRIHTAERRKTWLACDEHLEFLRDYLASREFPVTFEPFVEERGSA